MSIKLFTALVILGASAIQSFADESVSSAAAKSGVIKSKSNINNHNATQENLNITNEAEYADLVRSRERASRTSSSTSSISTSASSTQKAK